MPFLLRKIKKSRWYPNQPISWLRKNDLQADALVDLSTKNNTLSVWFIEDDKSNLERIISALAANCDDISNLDYALIGYESIKNINIKIKNSSGSSADDLVNNNWHYELMELSANQILSLADFISRKGEIKRITEQQVTSLIGTALRNKFLNNERIKDKIKNKVTTQF